MRAYYLLKTEQCYFPKGQSDELDCLTNSEITGAEVKAIRMTKQDIGVLEWEGNTAAGRSTGGRCVLRRAQEGSICPFFKFDGGDRIRDVEDEE